MILLLVVVFAIFLLLSKWYTLHERYREINIQAIVEERYEGTWTRRRSMGENMVNPSQILTPCTLDNDSDID